MLYLLVIIAVRELCSCEFVDMCVWELTRFHRRRTAVCVDMFKTFDEMFVDKSKVLLSCLSRKD